MTLVKTIYKNGEKINEFKSNGETAQAELVNLLIDKIQKRYKIQISFDHIHNETKANLYFDHETADNKKIKYRYNYFFYNIDSKINLY